MSASRTLHTYRFAAMGTVCTLHIYAADEVKASTAFASAAAEVERIERKYSRYDPHSLVSKINRAGATAGSVDIDDETSALIDYAFTCYAKSDGLFDITAGLLRQAWRFSSRQLPERNSVQSLLPRIGLDKLDWYQPRLAFRVAGMEIDLGGIGKEYAVDRVASLMHDATVESGLIDFGGDMTVLGPHPDGSPWNIGLCDPRRADAIITEVAIRRGSLATSGDYERCIEIDGRRYGHILDPRTGWPVEGLASVSALAGNCMVAGSVATIAMLKGHDGSAWLRSIGIAHQWVDTDGRQGSTLPTVFDVSPTQ